MRAADELALCGREPGRRPYLLLQRSAEDEVALSGLDHSQVAGCDLPRNCRMLGQSTEPAGARMRILITGACGFVGSSVAEALLQRREGVSICGVDNLPRPGSENNRRRLRELGVEFIHGDIRMASDVENLPAVDWVVDAAANPSVLAGVRGYASSRQLFEHNLASLVNVLEHCKRQKSGLILLSTNRVYSIPALRSLPLKTTTDAFQLDGSAALP